MLGIEDHFATGCLEVGNTLANDAQVLLARGPQDLVDVQRRALADDGHSRGAGFQQRNELRVVLRTATHTASATEGHHPDLLQAQVADTVEVRCVLGV